MPSLPMLPAGLKSAGLQPCSLMATRRSLSAPRPLLNPTGQAEVGGVLVCSMTTFRVARHLKLQSANSSAVVGRYFFIVHAGNEANGDGIYGSSSEPSNELLVGACWKVVYSALPVCSFFHEACQGNAWLFILCCWSDTWCAAPPGPPTAKASDTTSKQISLTITPGTPSLVSLLVRSLNYPWQGGQCMLRASLNLTLLNPTAAG